jgi:rhodanese-related sulfurtransferase
MARITIDELVARERRHPNEAAQAMRAGATLIDIRSDSQVARDGLVPGALVIARNALEWRLDPASDHRHPVRPISRTTRFSCAIRGPVESGGGPPLQQLGFEHAPDLADGFQAWRAEGLPVHTSAATEPTHLSGQRPVGYQLATATPPLLAARPFAAV